jgi:hypothetical protein
VANTFLTPTVIARQALATLYNTIVLAQLVWRDFDNEFQKIGRTVNVRKPAVFESEVFDRSKGTKAQNIDETEVPIELDTIRNVTVAVTDEEMTLDILDFNTQVLAGMMEAIAQDLDGDLAESLVEAAREAGQVATITNNQEGHLAANTAYNKAREILTRNKFPRSNRTAGISPEGTSAVLSDKLLVAANESGDTDALREAEIGKIYGIDSYETQEFGDGRGDKGEADGVAFHQSAVVLACRPLVEPKGVASSQVAVESFKSLSLRTVYQYNGEKKQDEVSVDTLYGIAVTRENGAVELDFGQGS